MTIKFKQKRNNSSGQLINWTLKALAIKQKAGDNPPCKPNGFKMGYMDIMKQLWDDKGYSQLGLTSQNLPDILNVNKWKVDKLSSQVEVTIATKIDIPEATSNNNHSNYDRNAAARIY